MFESNIDKGVRKGRIGHIRQLLPPIEAVKSLREADDLPRISLHGALQRYELEADEDCIFHCAFSVEISLLVRLDKHLSATKKESIRKDSTKNKAGLMFGKTITLAKDNSIISHDDEKKARKLNMLRNMYAHPGNWVAFIKEQQKMLTSPSGAEKEMPEVYAAARGLLPSMKLPSKEDAAFKKLEEAEKQVFSTLGSLTELPDLDWSASQDTLGFERKRIKRYYEEMIRRILTPMGLEDLIKHASNVVPYAQTEYSNSERDSYEALTYATEILKSLKVI